MNKPEYNSVTVSLGTGETVKDVNFPTINGSVVGLSTHLVSDRYGKRIRLALKDGGNETHRPIDVAFSETAGRGSFAGGQIPVNIQRPGLITASIQLDSALGAAETIKVEVVLISEQRFNENNNPSEDSFC